MRTGSRSEFQLEKGLPPDNTWSTLSRLAFARSAIRALTELHEAGMDDEPMVHRNLTPKNVCEKAPLCRYLRAWKGFLTPQT